MSIRISRAAARTVLVCLVAAGALASVLSNRAAASSADATSGARRLVVVTGATRSDEVRSYYPSRPITLEAAGHALLAYPPAASAPAHPTAVVYLHGIHGRPENGCPWFRAGAAELGWLVCPEGNEPAPNGTRSWGGDVGAQSAVVARALRAAEERGASTEPGVAIGFSQGGYVAVDLVRTHRAQFRGLVLIAAPGAIANAQSLREAGVVRVALASGSFDAAHAPLVEETKRLQRDGVEARFFDLGRVGHTYAAEDSASLREAIAWVGGGNV